MPKTTIKYGLRVKKTGEMVRYETYSNGDDYEGVGVSYMLTAYKSDPIWLVDSAEHAGYVRQFSTERYNAGFESPTHNFNPEDLEVVKVTMIEDIEPIEVKVPTYVEYIKEHYGKDDPGHANYILEELRKYPHLGKTASFSIYDYSELLRKQGKK
jgi:hypothetical protein